MLRFLTDENFNGDIVRGLQLRDPAVELARVQDVGLLGADDAAILAWAGDNGLILLTHDRATLPDFAYHRVTFGQAMPGLFVVPDRWPVGRAIEELLLLAACSEADDWRDRVLYLPL